MNNANLSESLAEWFGINSTGHWNFTVKLRSAQPAATRRTFWDKKSVAHYDTSQVLSTYFHIGTVSNTASCGLVSGEPLTDLVCYSTLFNCQFLLNHSNQLLYTIKLPSPTTSLSASPSSVIAIIVIVVVIAICNESFLLLLLMALFNVQKCLTVLLFPSEENGLGISKLYFFEEGCFLAKIVSLLILLIVPSL